MKKLFTTLLLFLSSLPAFAGTGPCLDAAGAAAVEKAGSDRQVIGIDGVGFGPTATYKIYLGKIGDEVQGRISDTYWVTINTGDCSVVRAVEDQRRESGPEGIHIGINL